MADTYVATDWMGRTEYCPIAIVNVDYVAKTRGVEGLDEARFTSRELVPRFGVVGLERKTDTYQAVLKYIDETIRGHETLLRRDVTVMAGINDVGRSIDYFLDGLEMAPSFVVISNDSGTSSYHEDVWTIPRTELIAALASAYATNLVKVSSKLKLAPVLNNQLVDLQIRTDAGTRVKRDSKDVGADDLARVLGMCLWMGRQEHTRDLTYLDRLEDEFKPTKEGWDVFRYARDREGQYG